MTKSLEQEAVDLIGELWKKKLPVKDIAEVIGITRQAVYLRLNQLGLKRKKEPIQWDDLPYDFTEQRLRNRAYAAVAKGLEKGLLTKSPCQVCGEEKTQAHHDDYKKPLDVRWLCIKHHNEWHMKKGKGKLTGIKRLKIKNNNGT